MDEKDKKDAAKAWILLILWVFVIAFLTLLPADNIPKTVFRKMDKVVHLLEFFALGFLMMNALFRSRTGIDVDILLIITVIAGSFYAGLGEWAQVFVPGRAPDMHDLISDLAGLNLGAFMYLRGARD